MRPESELPEFLTNRQIAAMLGLSPQTIDRMAAAGSMPPVLKIGRSKRWRRSDITAWIASGCQPVAKGGEHED